MLKWVALGCLLGQGLGKDSCPEWRAESEKSDCLWPRNAEGLMSAKPLMDAFMDKCKVKIDWKGQEPPDITDKHQIQMPEKCGGCAFKMSCQNREKQDGCFPLKAAKEDCTEHNDVCDMPKTPEFNNCRWSMLGAFMSQCVTNRPDLEEWRREGYHQGGKFFPEMNCKTVGEGCKCCCHPQVPVKKDGAWSCQDAPQRAEAEACPAFNQYNDWSQQCMWYPLTKVARDVNAHCNLQSLIGDRFNLTAVLEKRLALEERKAKEDTDRAALIKALPKKPCGFCSFRMRCAKRPHSDVCFGFDGDKKACGNDDCEGCGEPCDMGAIPTIAGDSPPAKKKMFQGIQGSCEYHTLIMRYLRKSARPMLAMVGNSYWKKRGFAQLMKFMPMGKCVQVDGGACKCCCHPYEPSEDGSQCLLNPMCRLPHDMGLDWETLP